MNKEMTICECCEAISELTHDEAINEILNYIEEKASHMSKKLVERKQQLKNADYELAETCIYLQQYEKALDKACAYLENIDYRCSYFERKYYQAIGQEVDEEDQDWNDKKAWKEILLKDD